MEWMRILEYAGWPAVKTESIQHVSFFVAIVENATAAQTQMAR